MKQNILITGSGVLGAYLAKILIRKKYNVFVTSRSKKFFFTNYEYLKISDRIKFLKLNVLNKIEINKVINKINEASGFINKKLKYPIINSAKLVNIIKKFVKKTDLVIFSNM